MAGAGMVPAGLRARREGRSLRVVHALHAWNDRTIAAVVASLATETARWGIDVSVVANTARASGPQLPPTIRQIDLGWPNLRSMASTPRLTAALRRLRPDVVFAHGNGPIRSVILATRFWRDRPVVVGFEHNHYSTYVGDYRRTRGVLNRLLLHRADVVAGVSPGIVEDLAEMFPRVSPILRMVPPPLTRWGSFASAATTDVDHPWFTGDVVPIIINVAHVHPRKDQLTLVRAFAHLLHLRAPRPARLAIIGSSDNAYAGDVRLVAEQHGVAEHVAFLGIQPDPLPFLARSAVFALSSRNEGMPVSLLEALACGTPAVSTDCPSGPRWLFDEERFGLLAPVGDPERLGAQIARVLDDTALAKRLRAAGRERAARFSPARIAQEQLALVGLDDVALP